MTIHKDGTFALRLGSSSSPSSFDDGNDNNDDDGGGNGDGRIWTSYDTQERKHYLNVHQRDLVGRYILQDNTKSAWQMELDPDKIRQAVDGMIEKLQEQENERN